MGKVLPSTYSYINGHIIEFDYIYDSNFSWNDRKDDNVFHNHAHSHRITNRFLNILLKDFIASLQLFKFMIILHGFYIVILFMI